VELDERGDSDRVLLRTSSRPVLLVVMSESTRLDELLELTNARAEDDERLDGMLDIPAAVELDDIGDETLALLLLDGVELSR